MEVRNESCLGAEIEIHDHAVTEVLTKSPSLQPVRSGRR